MGDMWTTLRGIAIGLTAATIAYLIWITVTNDGIITYRPLPIYAESHSNWLKCVQKPLRKIDYSERIVWSHIPFILEECRIEILNEKTVIKEEHITLSSYSDLDLLLPGAEFESLGRMMCDPVIELPAIKDDFEKRVFRNWLTRIVLANRYIVRKVEHSKDTKNTKITLMNVADTECVTN